MDKHVVEYLKDYLSNTPSALSIGTFGALAEFVRGADEDFSFDREALAVTTERGAVRLALRDDVVPTAYETVSAREHAWLHGVVFCLPEGVADVARRTSITELGPDREAVQPCHRDDVMFDLGLGAPHIDFCVRTGDRKLIDALRRSIGSRLLAPGNPIFARVIEESPDRVVRSKLGRVEVYQRIDTHRTPDGPHTHLLPKLLRSRRAIDARIALVPGYLPCLHVYPSSPLFDHSGEAIAYDPVSHARFDRLLTRWGRPEFVQQKNEVVEMVRDKRPPGEFEMPRSRLGRSAVRIALRQLSQQGTTRTSALQWRDCLNLR